MERMREWKRGEEEEEEKIQVLQDRKKDRQTGSWEQMPC